MPTPATAVPTDPTGSAASWLLDRVEAAAALAPVVALRGGNVEDLRVTGLRHRAGRRLAVRYGLTVRWPAGRSVETAVLLVDRDGPPDGAAVVAAPGRGTAAAWLYPWDPFLPGLASAATPRAVRDLLVTLGAADAPVAIRPRVYRPTARAVLAVEGATRVYLKVVRPQRAGELRDLHAALRGSLPVPTAHGCADEQGIVVLEACPGEELGAALTGGRRVPSPGDLLDLLDLLDGVADRPVAPATAETPAAQAAAYAGAIAAVLPGEAGRVASIADAAARSPWQPDRTVHGDFYEAQVLVADGRVSALLDVDRLRQGDAVDDVATLIAHLEALADNRSRAAARRGGGELLACRVAVALLGVASWPFRAQLPDWRRRTRRLVARAERALDEDALIHRQ